MNGTMEDWIVIRQRRVYAAAANWAATWVSRSRNIYIYLYNFIIHICISLSLCAVRESDRKPGSYVLSYYGRTGINHFR